MIQVDLARKLLVTDKAVSKWERGLGFPDIKPIEPLADALGGKCIRNYALRKN
nr:helix-turn-helix transcriptional regulator [Parablautia sp. Marseille-Q6255]